MKIYDGGSDSTEGYYMYNDWIDILLNEFTGNSLPPTKLSNVSTGNQIFILFASNGNGLGKGFSASFAFGKKTGNFNFF